MHKSVAIQKIIESIKAKNYLEIGVAEGENFKKISCDYKIGIEPVPSPGNFENNQDKIKYFFTTSDIFFANHDIKKILTNGIDVAFIDGLHEYNQVVRDVNNCLKYLNNGGFIVLHDCNPADSATATPRYLYNKIWNWKKTICLIPKWEGPWSGDVWKAIIELRQREDLNIFVLDCDFGLGILLKESRKIF